MNNKELTYRADAVRAIIGLGNPGTKYYKTRHSIGFRVLDELAALYGASWQAVNDMEYAQVQVTLVDGSIASWWLIKPMTYMNDSGKVMPWLTKKGVSADQIVVVHDELEKEFGYTGMKFGGSAKGHNGLRSIIERIGADYWRLRFGIARPERKEDVATYVLTPFTKAEEAELSFAIDRAIKKILGQG